METTEGSFLLMSRQNLLRLNGEGAVEYHTYLKAPGASGWQKFGSIRISQRYFWAFRCFSWVI